MEATLRHCPNPACPHRAKHGRPAEYRAGVETCSDCGAALAEGKGCFDHDDLDGAEPLDVLCGQPLSDKSVQGESRGPALVLGKPPGGASIPIIELGTGVALMGFSLWLVHQRQYWAVLGLVVGFVFFYLGVQRFKHRDRHERRVRPHRGGFVYEIDERGVRIALADLELAELNERKYRLRGVTIGVFHDLILSCREKTYTLTSFEPVAGLGPRETHPFVLWARGVVEQVNARPR